MLSHRNEKGYEEVPVSLKVLNIPNIMLKFTECSTYRNLFDVALETQKYDGLRGKAIDYIIEYKW